MEKFYYVMKYRPFGIGCQPTGHIEYIERNKSKDNCYGIIIYPFELHKDDLKRFELKELTVNYLKEGEFFKFVNKPDIFQYIKTNTSYYGDSHILVLNQTTKNLFEINYNNPSLNIPINFINVEIKEVI